MDTPKRRSLHPVSCAHVRLSVPVITCEQACTLCTARHNVRMCVCARGACASGVLAQNDAPLRPCAAAVNAAHARRNPVLSDLSAMKELITSQWINLLLVRGARLLPGSLACLLCCPGAGRWLRMRSCTVRERNTETPPSSCQASARAAADQQHRAAREPPWSDLCNPSCQAAAQSLCALHTSRPLRGGATRFPGLDGDAAEERKQSGVRVHHPARWSCSVIATDLCGVQRPRAAWGLHPFGASGAERHKET